MSNFCETYNSCARKIFYINEKTATCYEAFIHKIMLKERG